MFCNHCGHKCPDNFRFCPQCGKSMRQFCIHCGCAFSTGTKFCPQCGNAIHLAQPEKTGFVESSIPKIDVTPIKAEAEETPTMLPEASTEATRQDPLPIHTEDPILPAKKLPWKLILICGSTAFLLIATLLTGIFTNWFGLKNDPTATKYGITHNLLGNKGPLAQILAAAENSFLSGSFTIEISYDTQYWDDYEEVLTNNNCSGTHKIFFDLESSNVARYSEYEIDGNDYRECMWEDTYAYINDNGVKIIPDYSNAYLFYAIERLERLNLISYINQLVRDVDGIDRSKTKAIIQEILYETLTDEKWLKENFGFTKIKENNTLKYQFSVTPRSIYTLVETFAPAFEDKDKFHSFIDSLKSAEIYNIDVSVTTKRNQLISAEIHTYDKSDSRYFYNIYIDVYDIGSTEINENKCQKLMQEAEAITERHGSFDLLYMEIDGQRSTLEDLDMDYCYIYLDYDGTGNISGNKEIFFEEFTYDEDTIYWKNVEYSYTIESGILTVKSPTGDTIVFESSD